MALIACPGCSLPRTTSDSESACPVCGYSPTSDRSPPTPSAPVATVPLPAPIPATPAPRPLPAASPRDPSLLPWILAGIGFGGALVCAAGWYLASTDLPRLPDTVTAAPEVVARELAPTPRRAPNPTEVAPPPRGIVIVIEKPNPWLVSREGDFAVLHIDQPNDVYKLDILGAGNRLKLVGRAAKLSVDGVTGGAVLDATELVTKAVTFVGPIDGGSAVKLKVTEGGTVHVRGVLDESTLAVSATGGTVTFDRRTGKAAVAGRVTVTARSVSFAAPVSGPATRVDVTLTGRGTLRFVELSDAAKILYRSSRPDDPPPVVTPGTIKDTAECKRDE